MIEETIQKLTASIDALTAQLGVYNTVAERCVKTMHLTRLAVEASLPAPSPVADAPKTEAAPAAEQPKPDSIKKLRAKAAAEIAAAKAAETPPTPVAETPKAPESEAPKLPEQKDVIDIAGQLLVATNQNDGGFLKALAKELGLDKLRNAKPEQRQSIIDRINAEIERVKAAA